MRVVYSFLLLLCTLIIPCSSFAQIGTTKESKSLKKHYTKEKPLIYEDYWDLWPYSYIDDYGQPVGYHIDLVKKLLGDLNIPYEIHLKSSNRVLEDIYSGKADLMISVFREDRDSIGTWGNKNIALFRQGMLSAMGENREISRIEDIEDHNVVMRESSLVYKYVKELGLDKHVISVPDVKPYIFEAAETNKSIIIWNYVSLKFIKEKYNLNNLVLTPLNSVTAPSRFLGNDSLLISRLDEAFAKIDQRHLNEMRNKWIYPELQNTGIPNYAWNIFWLVLIIGITIFIGSLVINRLLRISFINRGEILDVMNTVMDITGIQIHIYDTNKQLIYIFAKNGKLERKINSADYLGEFTRKSVNHIDKTRMNIINGKYISKSLIIEKKTNDNKQFFFMTMTKCHLKQKNKSHILITLREISIEEQSRRNLANAYHRYHAAMEPPLVDHVVTNKEGNMLRGNANFFRTFGINNPAKFKTLNISIKDIPSLCFYDLKSNKPMRSVTIFDLDKVDRTEPFKDLITRRGKMYWDVQGYPSYNEKGEIAGLTISGRDVTDIVKNYRKQKQYIADNNQINDYLRLYLNELNIAFRSIHIVQAEYFPESHIFTVKRSIWKKQMEMGLLDAMAIIKPEDRDHTLAMMRLLDKKLNEDVKLQTHINIKNIVKNRWIEILFKPVLDYKGNVTHYIGTIQDRTNEETSFDKLIKENKSAVEADNLKSAFIANMHQQISTPLNAVISYANILSHIHDANDTQMYINEIKNNTDQLITLIDDILTLSRIDADMEIFKTEKTDFKNIIESNYRLLVMQYKHPKVACSLTGNYERLVLDIDGTHIMTIFKYLFSNSLRTTNSGWVNCRYMYRNSELIITIEDTGIGISTDKLDNAFVQTFTTNEGDKYNSGLTYTICKELVQRMGGHIEISTYPQQGTYIWIGIPCKSIEVISKSETKLSSKHR